MRCNELPLKVIPRFSKCLGEFIDVHVFVLSGCNCNNGVFIIAYVYPKDRVRALGVVVRNIIMIT